MSAKLLTIDDCKIIRQTVVNTLRNYDCLILEAADGEAGLAVARRERPDVILLDYKMPVMDGSEALARLRADPELRATPVIMLTAEASRESVLKIARLGVRDYLLKPFHKGVLVEKLSRIVTLHPRGESKLKVKRVDDPIQILVVDDQPAIVEVIRAGLSGTPWQVTGLARGGEALDACLTREVDLVLASLALPNKNAYNLFQNLRSHASTAAIPVFALSVKNAFDEHAAAQTAGFAGVITKPIDGAELRDKIHQALKLESIHKYFQQRGRTLVLTLPAEFTPGLAEEVGAGVGGQLTAAVNAGGDKFIIDITALPSATPLVMELLLSAAQGCGELALKHALVASEAIRQECQVHEQTRSWLFAGDYQQALGLLK
jgi:two-component system cell cycle response regulator